MKTIIAGTRTIEDKNVVYFAIEKSQFKITEVVSGKAKGVDSIGEKWAIDNNIPIIEFPAHWTQFGKKAGPLRNQEMVEYADALIAVWNGASSGTKDVINRARKNGLKIFIYNILEERQNKKSEKELSDLGFEF